MEGVKVATGVRKTKNRKVKDEFDRIKQAEKKMRRLEKALATSAAIRSELEKKKEKKKEQERLDEEGAAIAEAVALHVLVGEDSDDSYKLMLKKETDTCDFDTNIGIVTHGWQSLGSCTDLPTCLHEDRGWSVDPYARGNMSDHWGSSNLMVLTHPFDRSLYHQYLVEEDWTSVGVSAVAQTVSSLQIANDASYPFNHFLRR